MKQHSIGTKALAVAGMLLVWFPVFATVMASAAGWIIDHLVRLDYLMPAELAPSAIVGGGLLFWAALRAHSRHAAIGWGLGAMLVLLVGGQLLAEVTGLAWGQLSRPAGPGFWCLRRWSAMCSRLSRLASPACCSYAMSSGALTA